MKDDSKKYHATTGENAYGGAESYAVRKKENKRRQAIKIATQLHSLLKKEQSLDNSASLTQAIGNWLRDINTSDDRIVIGFVQCRECGYEWEALAYEQTVTTLECPVCSKQCSKVIGAAK